MSQKILMVIANREKLPCPVMPAGAIQLKKELEMQDNEVILLDLCFEKNYLLKFKKMLQKYSIGIIIFSVRNIDNETYLKTKFYLDLVKELILISKEYKNIKTIAGGVGLLTNDEAVFQYLGVDYGVIDRGYQSILKLVQKIKNKQDISGIDGVLYRKGGKIHRNVLRETRQMPILDWEYILKECDKNYFDYLSKKAPSPFGLQTKSGCYFQCIHCEVPYIEGRTVCMQDTEAVISSLKAMEDYGVSRCFITDNVFNYPYQEAYELCEKIVKEKIQIKWTCYLHPRYLDKKLAKMMIKAGCESVQFGIDTASDCLLKKWKKGFTSKDIINAGKICSDLMLKSSYSLLIGGWEENEDTLEESLSVLKEAKAKFIWAALGVRIQANTELKKILEKNMLIDKNLDLLNPVFYISPHIVSKYKEIVNRFEKDNPDILIKINGE